LWLSVVVVAAEVEETTVRNLIYLSKTVTRPNLSTTNSVTLESWDSSASVKLVAIGPANVTIRPRRPASLSLLISWQDQFRPIRP